jgi:predicted esterase YcpF (UPF0227 family)
VSQPTIVYLHGFRSSPASVKARLLQDAMAEVPPSRYLLLAQTGDEVLDYREAVSFYAGAWQRLQGGGDHALRNFEAVIPAILRFATPGNTAFGRAAPWGHP